MESIQEFILNCREHSAYRYVLSAPVKDAVYEKTESAELREYTSANSIQRLRCFIAISGKMS